MGFLPCSVAIHIFFLCCDYYLLISFDRRYALESKVVITHICVIDVAVAPEQHAYRFILKPMRNHAQGDRSLNFS